jgi:hypothetical protein
MKPIPAKPRMIIAHVEGSGTAATATAPISTLPLSEMNEVVDAMETSMAEWLPPLHRNAELLKHNKPPQKFEIKKNEAMSDELKL